MTIKPFIKAIAAMAVSGMMLNASANSAGLDAMEYDAASGTISVTLNYDFTDFAMFGGGLDITYDTSALEFMGYTQAELPADAQAPASPAGQLDAPGTYTGAGVGTFEFFNGMTSAGEIGTLVFSVLGAGDPSSTDCGMTICVSVNGINPFVSLAGQDVSAELLGNGISGANIINAEPVPVPAAVWFMLSGLGALFGFGRKSA